MSSKRRCPSPCLGAASDGSHARVWGIPCPCLGIASDGSHARVTFMFEYFPTGTYVWSCGPGGKQLRSSVSLNVGRTWNSSADAMSTVRELVVHTGLFNDEEDAEYAIPQHSVYSVARVCLPCRDIDAVVQLFENNKVKKCSPY